MRKNRRLIALGALLALGLPQARSHDALNAGGTQDPETTADVRCLVVGFAISSDPAKQAAGTMLSFYYIGRISGRAPQVDLEALLLKEIDVMTQADLNSEAQRCGASLTAKGKEIAQIGKNLTERAKTQSAKSKPPAKS